MVRIKLNCAVFYCFVSTMSSVRGEKKCAKIRIQMMLDSSELVKIYNGLYVARKVYLCAKDYFIIPLPQYRIYEIYISTADSFGHAADQVHFNLVFFPLN